MYWNAVDVTAHVNADGSLRVRERQEFVFDGAWNGGERRFDLRAGQGVDIDAVYREDTATGKLIPLQEEDGSLDQVDHFNWTNGDTLRWRSRLPTDPPFNKTKLVYVIDMIYHNVILKDGDEYRLDHDFSFPDRDWEIRKFTLNLTWDKAWVPAAPIVAVSREQLQPGESVVVDTVLSYHGSGVVNVASKLVPTATRGVLLAALAVFCSIAMLAMYRSEKSSGLFDAPLPTHDIDDTWLQKYLFAFPAEVVAAVWRDDTAVEQVSALLARMQYEGKISSEVNEGVMRLILLVDRGILSGYEAKLVSALFVNGASVDMNQLKQHYRTSGFSPAGIIKSGIQKAVRQLLGITKKSKSLWVVLWLLTGSGEFLFLWGWVEQVGEEMTEFVIVATVVFSPLLFAVLGALIVHSYRNTLDNKSLKLTRRMFFLFLKMTPLLLLACGVVLLGGNSMPMSAFVGLVLWAAGLFALVLNFSRVRESRAYVDARRRFDAARRYFEIQLTQGAAQIEARWTPYLVVFGLAEQSGLWSQGVTSPSSDGSNGSDVPSRTRDTGSARTQTTIGSGGGGSFGGAGATGSWSDFAQGVTAPPTSARSGSSSSSSRSSSRSSSGGGGGGAW